MPAAHLRQPTPNQTASFVAQTVDFLWISHRLNVISENMSALLNMLNTEKPYVRSVTCAVWVRHIEQAGASICIE